MIVLVSVLMLSIQLLPAICPASGEVDNKPGDHYESITVDGLKRTYLLHIPKNFDGKKSLPLLLSLHGGFGNASYQSSKTGISDLSDKENFIVAYPEAYKNYGHWNDGRGLSKADDVKFVSTLIDNLVKRLSADPKRVYACGVSNGGIMSYRLGLELSGKIAAIVSVAGSQASLLPLGRPDCFVPFMEIHGTADTLVPWKGGKAGVGGTVLSVEESLRRWTIFNNASSIPTVTDLPHKDPKDKTRVARLEYKDVSGKTMVSLIKITGGGHGWPRGDKTDGGMTKDIDATQEVWNFLKNYTKSDTNGRKILKAGGLEREYFVHEPDNRSGLPVVILLHGGGGTTVGTLVETDMMSKSDASGFILVTPEATRPDMKKPGSFTKNPQTWNDGSGRFSQNINDVAFISALIDKVVTDCNANKNRVFVTGFSNGASMTNRVGAELSTKVRAIAPVSGHLWMDYKTLSKPVAVCTIIGTDDPLNPINGGNVKVPSGETEYHPPIQKTVDKWTALDGCTLKPETTTVSDGVTVQKTGGCKGDARIEYWIVKGLGHVWPGAATSLLPATLVGKPSDRLEANDVIWEFFDSFK